jgi:hypothetical protein
MREHTKFVIDVYHDGVVIPFHMRGKDRYLKEKAFLEQLTGLDFAPELLPRPIPDPTSDMYIMNDEQLDLYLGFRRSLDGKSPKLR